MKCLVLIFIVLSLSQAKCFPTVASDGMDSYWYNEMSNNPEAAPYIQKIVTRLDEMNRPDSDIIMKRAKSFFNKQQSYCKSPFTGVQDLHCLGRLTGLTLGLINSLETTFDTTRMAPFWDPETEFTWKFQRF